MPEYKYVRTDSRVTTLDTFVFKPTTQQKQQSENDESMQVDTDELSSLSVETVKKPRVEVRLTSILQLRKDIKKQGNTGLLIHRNINICKCTLIDHLSCYKHIRKSYIYWLC